MRSSTLIPLAAAVLPVVMARPNDGVFQRGQGGFGGQGGGGFGGFGGGHGGSSASPGKHVPVTQPQPKA